MKTVKKRYRLLSLLLAVTLVLGLLTVSIFAADPITFSATSASGWAGDSFTVTVSVTANSTIGAADLQLNYDSTLLTCTSTSKGTLGDASLNPNFATPGVITYHVASTTGITDAGTLFTATFSVNNDAIVPQTTPMTLTAPLVKNTASADLANTANSGTITILGIAFSTSKTNVTIRGGSNGSITVTSPTGGSGTYQYSKNGGTTWQDGASFTSLAAGSYDIKVRDKNTPAHVSAATTVTLTQPNAVTITSATPTDATTFHGTNGQIVVVAAGGNGTYQYSKDNGVTWQDSNTFLNLGAAIYQVKARDKADTANASAASAVTVSQPGAVTISLTTKTDVVQYGASTGEIVVAAQEGGGTYEFTKDDTNWQTSGTFSGLAAGTYHIRARDAADHSNTSTLLDVTLTQPTAVSFTFAKTNVTVFGTSTGEINVTPAGGLGTYQYSTDNGTNWSDDNPITGLAAGTYQVKVRDKVQTQNVSAAQSVTITQPTAVSFTFVKTNTTAAGADDGSITVTAAGGVGAIEYSKDNGANFQASNVFSSLAPGAYQIVVRDSTQNLNVSAAQTVNIYNAVSFTTVKTDLTIRNGSNGQIVVTAAGGSSTYQYSKDGGTTWQDSNTFPGLTAGTYSIKARDKNEPLNAAAAQSVTLTQPAAVTIDTAQTNVALYGASTGQIVVTPGGGNGTYEYSKDGGSNWQDSNTFSSLTAGTYSVKVRDKVDTANLATKSVTITQPGRVTVSGVVETHVTTFTGSDGTITVTAINASAGNYEYSKNGGTTWQDSNAFTNLTAGTYAIKARDKDNTVNTSDAFSVTITKPAAVTFTAVMEGCLTTASNDGKITVTAAGGKGTYQYSKDDGATWQDSNQFTGLALGIYKIKVRDKVDTTNVSAATSVEVKLKGTPLTANDPGAVTATSSTPSSAPASSAATSSTAVSSVATSSAASSSAASSTTTVVNSTTSVAVEAPSGVIPAGTTLQVEEVKLSSTDKKDLQKEIEKKVGDIILTEGTTYFVYDITLTKDNTTVQPNGKVTVKIPLNGLSPDFKIFRVESDGSLTDMKGKVVDGFIVFETDHFSQYVVVNTADINNPDTGSGNAFSFLFGAAVLLMIGASVLVVPQRKRK